MARPTSPTESSMDTSKMQNFNYVASQTEGGGGWGGGGEQGLSLQVPFPDLQGWVTAHLLITYCL